MFGSGLTANHRLRSEKPRQEFERRGFDSPHLHDDLLGRGRRTADARLEFCRAPRLNTLADRVNERREQLADVPGLSRR
jgi:hypothetical protein